MRGKEEWCMTDTGVFGITPAYAGKSRRGSLFGRAGGDHPRVCGEKHSRAPAAHNDWGSPPRMRGKGAAIVGTRITPGITPAYAGKRKLHCQLVRLFKDHPRVCGEKRDIQLNLAIQAGSPPRMRGKVCVIIFGKNVLRITPAYAGKSAPTTAATRCIWDHPRVCGEKFRLWIIPSRIIGSPPRMRGKD